jgi:hypothetical protein
MYSVQATKHSPRVSNAPTLLAFTPITSTLAAQVLKGTWNMAGHFKASRLGMLQGRLG